MICDFYDCLPTYAYACVNALSYVLFYLNCGISYYLKWKGREHITDVHKPQPSYLTMI